MNRFQDISGFSWVAMKQPPSWENFEASVILFGSKLPDTEINDIELFDEVNNVCRFESADKISNWNSKEANVDIRWVVVFSHFQANSVPCDQIQTIIEFILYLHGTNAPTERILSHMNTIWTSEKTQLCVQTMKTILMVKYNF
jgi:hypothetical protein